MAASVETATSILRDLIAFDTTSRNTNLPIIDYIAEFLSAQGVSSRIVKSEDGQKANLFATVGPNLEGGIVLSGHSDVVPVDGQDWSTDPFDMTERDGRLYGRGDDGNHSKRAGDEPFHVRRARSAGTYPSRVFL